MLHIHKNTDKTFHISIVLESENKKLLIFDGDFTRCDDGLERVRDDNESFILDIPLNIK